MTTSIKLLDIVALTVDLPEYNLWRGQVGTIVDILAGGSAFEVEFSDRQGRTFESLGLRPDQLMVLLTTRCLPCHPRHRKQQQNKRDAKKTLGNLKESSRRRPHQRS